MLNIDKCDLVVYASGNNTVRVISVSLNFDFAKQILICAKENYFKKMLHSICILKPNLSTNY